MPIIVVLAAVVVVARSGDRGSGTATPAADRPPTLVVDPIDRAGPLNGDQRERPVESASPPAEGASAGESAEQPIPGAPPSSFVEAGERPGSPRGRGTSEGDPQTSPVSYAPAPDPAEGCGVAEGDVVEFVFDGAALAPRCVRVRADQRVAVVNRSSIEAGVYVGALMETVAPGDSAQFGNAGSAFDGRDRADVWVSGYPEAVATLATR